MYELSLFSGIGGGLLASRLLHWHTIGAVEIDDDCCQVIDRHQQEGRLHRFPIWNPRMDNGLPDWLEPRIRALGNAQVPTVAAAAWRLLTQ